MDDVMPSHAVERDRRGMDIADRQLTGTGAIMGIGQALLEATATDRTTARILNPASTSTSSPPKPPSS